MPEEQVAHRSADERDVIATAGLGEQLGPARQTGETLQRRGSVVDRVRGAHEVAQPMRTGSPAAARCALASAIVKRP